MKMNDIADNDLTEPNLFSEIWTYFFFFWYFYDDVDISVINNKFYNQRFSCIPIRISMNSPQ